LGSELERHFQIHFADINGIRLHYENARIVAGAFASAVSIAACF
jgi:hypothetical protein